MTSATHNPAQNCVKELTTNLQIDENSIYLGMPVAIQVVALTHQDEALLGAVAVIDKLVKC